MNPRNTGTKIGIVVTVALVVAVVFAWNLALPSRLQPTAGPAQLYSPTLYPTEIEGLAESCSDIYRWTTFTKQNYPLLPEAATKQANLPIPVIENIAVPVVGYLAPKPLPRSAVKFYSRKADPKLPNWQVLRLMYDYNVTVIWYDNSISDENVASIRTEVAKHPGTLMALPWDEALQRQQPLPRGSGVAYASWATSQNCLNWNTLVLNQYLRQLAQYPAPRVPSSQLITGKESATGQLQIIDPLVIKQVKRARRLRAQD